MSTLPDIFDGISQDGLRADLLNESVTLHAAADQPRDDHGRFAAVAGHLSSGPLSSKEVGRHLGMREADAHSLMLRMEKAGLAKRRMGAWHKGEGQPAVPPSTVPPVKPPSPPSSPVPSSPQRTAGGSDAHIKAIAKAFLAHPGSGSNLVDIADISKATGHPHVETMRGIDRMRREGHLSASAYEGRQGLSPEQVAVKAAQSGEEKVGFVHARDVESLRRIAGA